MEGVIDFAMREILTGLGGYHHAVTEFIRINEHFLPKTLFINMHLIFIIVVLLN